MALCSELNKESTHSIPMHTLTRFSLRVAFFLLSFFLSFCFVCLLVFVCAVCCLSWLQLILRCAATPPNLPKDDNEVRW